MWSALSKFMLLSSGSLVPQIQHAEREDDIQHEQSGHQSEEQCRHALSSVLGPSGEQKLNKAAHHVLAVEVVNRRQVH